MGLRFGFGFGFFVVFFFLGKNSQRETRLKTSPQDLGGKESGTLVYHESPQGGQTQAHGDA